MECSKIFLEKQKKRQYACEQYKKFLENEKQRLVWYINNGSIMQKYVCFIFLNFYCLPQVTLTDKDFSNFILSIKTIGDYKKLFEIFCCLPRLPKVTLFITTFLLRVAD